MLGTGWNLLKIGNNGGLCESDNEPPGSLKASYLVISYISKGHQFFSYIPDRVIDKTEYMTYFLLALIKMIVNAL